MNLNDLASSVRSNARAHGFVREGEHRLVSVHVALIHSEVSELFEAYRDHLEDTTDENGKPIGMSSEAADIIIRVLDFASEYGIDIDQAVEQKMEYNKTRSFKHGGKAV